MKSPTMYVTFRLAGEDPAHFALAEDSTVVAAFGDPPDWSYVAVCNEYESEYPETHLAVEMLLRALRKERLVLGHGYTAHELQFSLNEHDVLRDWIRATRPGPGEYVIGSEYNPKGLVVESPTRVVVHDDLYITRRGGTDG